jgi:hypothetical protein
MIEIMNGERVPLLRFGARRSHENQRVRESMAPSSRAISTKRLSCFRCSFSSMHQTYSHGQPAPKSLELNSAKQNPRNFFAQPFSRALLITGLPVPVFRPCPERQRPNAWAGMDLSRRRAAYSQFSVCVDDHVGVVDGRDQLLVLVAMSMRFAVRVSGECSCS